MFAKNNERPTPLLRLLTTVTMRHGAGLSGEADDVGAVVAVVLRALGARVSDQASTAAAAVSKHYKTTPLMAAKEALRTWGVSAKAAKVTDVDPDGLVSLTFPLIALKIDGKLLAILSADKHRANVFDTELGFRTVATGTVLSMVTGLILYVDKTLLVVEPNYQRSRRAEVWSQIRPPVLFLLLLVTGAIGLFLASATIVPGQFMPWLILTVLSFAGLATSAILVSAYIGDGQAFRRLCPIDETWNCQSVLGSEHAKFLGIPLADIGLVYFGGLTVNLMVLATKPFLLPLVVPLLLAPIPVAYFLYLQKFKIKQWCSLCLAVHGVMMLQFLTVMVSMIGADVVTFAIGKVEIGSLLAPLLGWMTMAILWSFVRPTLSLQKENDGLQRLLLNVLFSEGYFRDRLSSATSVDFDVLPSDIQLSPKQEPIHANELGFLLSSSCPSCGVVLKNVLLLIEMMDYTPVHYRVRIIVSDEASYLVVRHVLALAKSGDQVEALKAMEAWINDYRLIGYDAWLRTRQHDQLDQAWLAEAEADMESVDNWLQSSQEKGAAINAPIIFVNGRSLPDHYVGQEILIAHKLASSKNLQGGHAGNGNAPADSVALSSDHRVT